jgi:hypothetical protein
VDFDQTKRSVESLRLFNTRLQTNYEREKKLEGNLKIIVNSEARELKTSLQKGEMTIKKLLQGEGEINKRVER